MNVNRKQVLEKMCIALTATAEMHGPGKYSAFLKLSRFFLMSDSDFYLRSQQKTFPPLLTLNLLSLFIMNVPSLGAESEMSLLVIMLHKQCFYVDDI